MPNVFYITLLYKNSFGILDPDGKKPQEIILSFHPRKGKYMKTLKLHESQQIIKDNDEELQIKLFLVITFDFRMEIQSHADEVKVLKPISFANELKEIYQNAINQYKKNTNHVLL